ncbi:helix-turn-helix domain-containing protein [Streptomyces armeniacus]|nr:helix-turn-helix transcriptional regulator [Streptomyces armeniacus]
MSDAQELARLLQELKDRSGRSFAALARQTGLSRSSLHRYCTGTTVPGSFGTVERIARACAAEPDELDGLYRLWARADTGREEQAEQENAEPEGAEPEGAEPEDSPPRTAPAARTAGTSRTAGTASPTAPRMARRRLAWLRALAAVALLAVTAVASTALPYDDGPRAGERGDGGRRLPVPPWSMEPRGVPPEFFGVTMNTDTGAMPGFRVGAVRLWESETRWSNIETRRGHRDWTVLERMVSAARRARLPVLYTFGGTPHWAAPGGVRSVYTDARAAPPDDLRDWDRFVHRVATRFRGRIDAYELWDNVGSRSHYAGSVRTLAEMTRRAARIIRRADPDAAVACPSVSRLWEEEGRDFLRALVATGVYDYCDAAAVKLHPRRADGPPEEMIELARRVQRTLYQADIAVPLWNTGPGKDIATTPHLDARRAADHAVRFYLAGLYSRFFNVSHTYFYSWGGPNVPVVLQLVGEAPTEAARHVERLQEWLDGARLASCGQGRLADLPENAYRCRFERSGTEAGERERFLILWTSGGHADTRLGEGAYRVREMGGDAHAVRPGERVRFGERPAMVELRD